MLKREREKGSREREIRGKRENEERGEKNQEREERIREERGLPTAHVQVPTALPWGQAIGDGAGRAPTVGGRRWRCGEVGGQWGGRRSVRRREEMGMLKIMMMLMVER